MFTVTPPTLPLTGAPEVRKRREAVVVPLPSVPVRWVTARVAMLEGVLTERVAAVPKEVVRVVTLTPLVSVTLMVEP